MSRFNCLVLSGGGSRGVLQLGALHALSSHWMRSVNLVVGSSIGGVVGALVLLGYAPAKIHRTMLTPQLMSQFSMQNICWSNSLKQGWLFSWDILEQLIRAACEEKLGYVPSLSEFEREIGKQLVVTSYCLQDQRTEYLSPQTHPDMCLIQALRMTTAIPFVFPKVIYDGKHYVDGSIGQHVPWRYLLRPLDLGSDDEELKILVVELSSPSIDMSTNDAPAGGLGKTIMGLLMASLYVNQEDNQMLAASMFLPRQLCWISLVSKTVGQSMDSWLTLTEESSTEMWQTGKYEAMQMMNEFNRDEVS